MENSLLILLQLLLAHIITDFALQPTKLIVQKREKKSRSAFLYVHSLIAGLLTFIFLMRLEWWYIAVFISVAHFFTDLWKLHKGDNLKLFLFDQFLHLLAILVAWLFLTSNFENIIPFFRELLESTTFLSLLLGYLIIIFPAGFLIGKATKKWQTEADGVLLNDGLNSAGRYIGIFERILVLTFILTSNFSAIGFLIAAKSILRFSDKSQAGARKQTEYVLVGTLLSFSITIIIGLLVRQIAF
ncbi:DUF3307 domain-containing protein [Christiangramia fulva]|uniref:DUF3307 domain-containing protein n=1 Tax=Christiangramia fulva TaxID=2126553 RepID=A0A2R3Z7U1_9FLAO|nr:DUF3307 domain-containing protein [Christiangramia fulva]AVR46295.1 DUF3307 domain-containing protein [Christiangramia fulva]